MRCLVLSDIHSNLDAFQAVLDDAGPVDRVWCLGDVVGYGPDPNGCVELLRSLPHLCIAGNHDWATLGKLDLRDFNPDAREANLWNRQQLTPENLAYLDARPETLEEGDFTLTHGSPRHPIWEYIIYASTAQINFGHFNTPFCFVGHTHTPMIRRYQKSLIVNPGSVGQPRDNDARAAFAILDLEELSWRYERVAYPIELTQGQMKEAGLPRRLIDRLSFGWECDTIPYLSLPLAGESSTSPSNRS